MFLSLSSPRLARALIESVLLFSACLAVSNPTQANSIDRPSPTGRWWIELHGEPIVSGGDPAAEQERFITRLNAIGLAPGRIKLNYRYAKLFNGFSLSAMDSADLATVAQLPEVKAIHPVGIATIDPIMAVSEEAGVAKGEVEYSWWLRMTGVDRVHRELDIRGRGVKLAIVDSGVEYRHQDLGGCFGGPVCRVIDGYDFVGDAFDLVRCEQGLKEYCPVEDGVPNDTNGHGTHVAGIAAAHPKTATGVRGVADQAQLLAYRVFGPLGTTSFDIVASAVERAYADGAQVINLSLGSAGGWPQEPVLQMYNRLVEHGVVIVAAVGNNGAVLYYAGVPGTVERVIGVASVGRSADPTTPGPISSFSSAGPTPRLEVKPDLAAPGGNIRSTYLFGPGEPYREISGTSMASPHVAGAVALMLEARPSLVATSVRDLLQNAAEPTLKTGAPGAGELDIVHRQGAGVVNIYRTLTNMASGETLAIPARLRLGPTNGASVGRTLTLYNRGEQTATYTFEHRAALATGDDSARLQYLSAAARLAFKPATLTVAPGGWGSVDITFDAPDHSEAEVFGGYVAIRAGDKRDPIHVPYVGFNGDYFNKSILDFSTGARRTCLARRTPLSFRCVSDGETFSMQSSTETPLLRVFLQQPARYMASEVYNDDTDEFVGSISGEDYLPRSNGQSTAEFLWDGKVWNEDFSRRVDVPNGSYRIILYVQKPLAEWSSEDAHHWAVLLTPRFSLERP